MLTGYCYGRFKIEGIADEKNGRPNIYCEKKQEQENTEPERSLKLKLTTSESSVCNNTIKHAYKRINCC